MLNLRVQEVHSKDAFLVVEDEEVVDEDMDFLVLGLWAAADGWAIDGLTSPIISESEEVGESMVTVFIITHSLA